MTDLLTSIFKSLGCSQCQEFEYHENTSKKFKNWKLFLKKYDMYTAMILYNEKFKKDISHIINKNDLILLLNEKNEVYMKLEYVSYNEESKISILVPTDEYHELYQKIEEQDKEFNKELEAYYIGTYSVKKI